MDEFTDRDYQRAQFFAKYVALRGWEFESLDDKKFDEAASFILSSRSAESRFWLRSEGDRRDAVIEEIKGGVLESDKIILNWSSNELFKLSSLPRLADSSKQSDQQKRFWCRRANAFQGKRSADGSWVKNFKKSNGLSLSVAMILKAFDNCIGGLSKYKHSGGVLPKELTIKFAELKLRVSRKADDPRMWVEGPAAGLGESRDWVKEKRSHLIVYGASQCKDIESLPISPKSS